MVLVAGTDDTNDTNNTARCHLQLPLPTAAEEVDDQCWRPMHVPVRGVLFDILRDMYGDQGDGLPDLEGFVAEDALVRQVRILQE